MISLRLAISRGVEDNFIKFLLLARIMCDGGVDNSARFDFVRK